MAQRGGAFVPDVKEALGGRGNVDHVVMTPAGIRVVEAKSDWLPERRLPSALRHVAENVRRVRDPLDITLPISGALVIADPSRDSYEADDHWNGEPVRAFGAKTFWRVLSVEREQTGAHAPSPEVARVARAVWKLGSTDHLEP